MTNPSDYPVDTTRVLTWLQEMVRINSVNPDLAVGGLGEGDVARWLAEICIGFGLEVRLQDSAPGRPNVIARWPGRGGGKSLLLTGHTDTVGIDNMDGDPLSGHVEGNRLYGRGAYDMKGGIAAVLGAVAALQAGNFTPAGDVLLGFVTDEEYASIGTDVLVHGENPVHADAALLVEPTDNAIVVAHKGFTWATLTTEGRAAHGSLYTHGVDAIAHMGRLLHELDVMERETFLQDEHPLLGRPSAHASGISGGLGWSTYPDRCTLQVEHRLLPHQTADDVQGWWQNAMYRLHEADEQFRGSVEIGLSRPGYEIERSAPIVQTLERAIVEESEQPPAYRGMWAWMDSAILSRAGIPTVMYGPSGEGMHAATEYVNLDSVYLCAAVYTRVIAAWCG